MFMVQCSYLQDTWPSYKQVEMPDLKRVS